MPLPNCVKPKTLVLAENIATVPIYNLAHLFTEMLFDKIAVIDFAEKTDALTVGTLPVGKIYRPW